MSSNISPVSSDICQYLPGKTIDSCHSQQYENQELDLSALKLTQLPPDIFSYVMNLVAKGKTSEEAAQNAIAMSQVCVLTHLYSHQGDPLKVINQFKLDNDALKKIWDEISKKFYFNPPSVPTQIHTWFENPLDTLQKMLSGSLEIQYQAVIPNTLTEVKAWMEDSVNADQLNAVTTLSLWDAKLPAIPPQISKLTQLWNINLDNNQIITIPDFLENLPELKWLFLSDNRITAIPDSLGNISQLDSLGLANNQIKTIPESFKKLIRLQWINLNGNQISTIPDFFENLICLELLFLRNNQITTIPDSLGKLTQLKSLDLTGNPLFCICDKNRVMTFEGYGEIQSVVAVSKEFSDYKCLHSFSSFVQDLALGSKDPETVKNAFFHLARQDRNLIYEMVYHVSNVQTDNSKWGEEHAFDDMNIFCHAVRKSIPVKFDRLSQAQKNTVYGHIYKLAGNPVTTDLCWGESNAFENVLRLCDAIQQLYI